MDGHDQLFYINKALSFAELQMSTLVPPRSAGGVQVEEYYNPLSTSSDRNGSRPLIRYGAQPTSPIRQPHLDPTVESWRAGLRHAALHPSFMPMPSSEQCCGARN